MADLSAFAITQRWPAQNPDVIQLYSFPTPNGIKASVMLEETGLAYEAHKTFSDADLDSAEFLSLNPNHKIPAIIDPHGPDGQPIGLFESGAILIYLAEKTGRFYGKTATERAHITQWLMWQMGGLGPMFGQMGFFCKYAGKAVEDPLPRNRYLNESARLLRVLDGALEGKEWIVGDYSIADMAIAPWINALDYYDTKHLIGWDTLKNVPAYAERFSARPAAQRAKNIPDPKG